ncbi:Glycerol-3-phosphate dehydrogenase [NAD(P)+] [Chlamydiales bacterium SCGC AG-110-M15]|nr:Glycerol-3-phosphate dehydrogenase [NAD(P)+] [Chlamydiales bacterium SCGC AG-110-M15]
MFMKIGYLGAGTWGFCLANLLASKGFDVILWSIESDLITTLKTTRQHPRFPGHIAPTTLTFTQDLKNALDSIDYLIEGVSSSGVRPVFESIKKQGVPSVPVILTSKGIEQNSHLLLSDVAVDVFGEEHRHQIACISGPSHAEEVIKGLPTSVSCSAYDSDLMNQVSELFSTDTFRVYPNRDINGMEFGGAMKNIVAIACGISDGLGYGDNTKAALMTRGLHEIRKLAVTAGCQPETLNGLSGMGDLCVTCMSTHSRNYRFGRYIAEGFSSKKAQEKVGMVVEGAYSCVSAMQISEKSAISAPITEAIYKILYEGHKPKEAVKELMLRKIKEEHL